MARTPDNPLFDIVMGAVVPPLVEAPKAPALPETHANDARLAAAADEGPRFELIDHHGRQLAGPAPAAELPVLTGWTEPPAPSAELAELAQEARLALEIGGARTFQVPAKARALLEAGEERLASARDACERERLSGRRLDAIDACAAVVRALT